MRIYWRTRLITRYVPFELEPQHEVYIKVGVAMRLPSIREAPFRGREGFWFMSVLSPTPTPRLKSLGELSAGKGTICVNFTFWRGVTPIRSWLTSVTAHRSYPMPPAYRKYLTLPVTSPPPGLHVERAISCKTPFVLSARRPDRTVSRVDIHYEK